MSQQKVGYRRGIGLRDKDIHYRQLITIALVLLKIN